MAKWTAAAKIKQKMILTTRTQETTFYGIAADTGRGLRFLGGVILLYQVGKLQIPTGDHSLQVCHRGAERAQTQIPSLKSLNLRE